MRVYNFLQSFQNIEEEEFFLIHTLRLAFLSYQNQMKISQEKETTGQHPSWTEMQKSSI